MVNPNAQSPQAGNPDVCCRLFLKAPQRQGITMASRRFIATGLVIVTAITAVILIWLVKPEGAPNNNLNNPESTNSPSLPAEATDNKSPDRVKSSSGDNGDTTPSPNGTGTGSDNSFLSQP